jgi:hypothetical protein
MALAREECRAQYIEKHLLPVVLKNPDWKSIFTPGWWLKPGVIVPLLPGAINAESNSKSGAESESRFSTSEGRQTSI